MQNALICDLYAISQRQTFGYNFFVFYSIAIILSKSGFAQNPSFHIQALLEKKWSVFIWLNIWESTSFDIV